MSLVTVLKPGALWGALVVHEAFDHSAAPPSAGDSAPPKSPGLAPMGQEELGSSVSSACLLGNRPSKLACLSFPGPWSSSEQHSLYPATRDYFLMSSKVPSTWGEVAVYFLCPALTLHPLSRTSKLKEISENYLAQPPHLTARETETSQT